MASAVTAFPGCPGLGERASELLPQNLRAGSSPAPPCAGCARSVGPNPKGSTPWPLELWPSRRRWQGFRLPAERFWDYTRRAAEADARLCRGATALGIGCIGDRWSPGADSPGSAPSLGCPPAATSSAPSLRITSGGPETEPPDGPARLRPQAADLGGARSKIARTSRRAWRHPSASSRIRRYARSGGTEDVPHGTAHRLESCPQAGRLRLRRLPPAPRQARRQLLGNRLASPPAVVDPAATAGGRTTSSACRCSACRPRWSAPCVTRPARVATRLGSRTRRGPTASSARQGPSAGSWPVGQTPHVAGHGLHLRHLLGHRASRCRDGRGLEPRLDQPGGRR